MTARARARAELSEDEALRLADASPADVRALMTRAATVRDAARGRTLTYSPKVFLPITNLCRNRCEYCAFRRSPGDAGEWTMSPREIDRTLSAAAEQGCFEALICLGDTPETAFPSYRRTLAGLGHATTVDYVEWACERALSHGLLPHTNAGILQEGEMRRLKSSNASLGLMLENVSLRLCGKGMPHHRAPDKRPAVRLGMLETAGKLAIPFTTGILVGIGETARERVEALLAIARAHARYGHVQEVIVQNFTPHEKTPMASREPPDDRVMAHAIALARLILPDDVSVQAPPNLNAERTALLVDAGIDDFGGISPVTIDYINPDRPWPLVTSLGRTVSALGFELVPRLCVYDRYIDVPGFLDPDRKSVV
jgi:7,8-didemethyl-8-hydroxy-5-deazariboflavin synthase CofG subunit